MLTTIVVGKLIGIPSLINGFIFLVGATSPSYSSTTTTTGVSLVSAATCINIFYSAGYQFSWLMGIFMMDYDAPALVAGIAIIWSAMVTYHPFTRRMQAQLID